MVLILLSSPPQAGLNLFSFLRGAVLHGGSQRRRSLCQFRSFQDWDLHGSFSQPITNSGQWSFLSREPSYLGNPDLVPLCVNSSQMSQLPRGKRQPCLRNANKAWLAASPPITIQHGLHGSKLKMPLDWECNCQIHPSFPGWIPEGHGAGGPRILRPAWPLLPQLAPCTQPCGGCHSTALWGTADVHKFLRGRQPYKHTCQIPFFGGVWWGLSIHFSKAGKGAFWWCTSVAVSSQLER